MSIDHMGWNAGAGVPRGALVSYVTSHGFGHLNRTAAVLNRLPPDLPVVVRSDPSLFGRWAERVEREVILVEGVFDTGAVNPPGDSARTDIEATLERALEVDAISENRAASEAVWLRDNRAAGVLCDAPALPLAAARSAGIPSFLVANFTWADIYARYVQPGDVASRRMLGRLRTCYRQSTRAFRAQPALAMRWMSDWTDVGLVVSSGRDRRREILDAFGLDRDSRLVSCYFGKQGQRNLAWERLERLGRNGIHFVGFHVPSGQASNFHELPAGCWNGSDLAASCDAVLAKAGYGTVSEAMSTGTPILYPPRTGFAEHRALDRSLREWGGGVPISNREYREGRIEAALTRAFSAGTLRSPFPIDGAARVAKAIAERIGLKRRTVVSLKGLPA
jgi:hypothetical protein